jgi:hypothetical protein
MSQFVRGIGPAVAMGFSVMVGLPAMAQTVATTPDIALPEQCEFSKPAQLITSLSDLPEVAAEFDRLRIDIADSGEPFVPYDFEDEASRGLPHRQFLRAYVFTDQIVVWYYHGGFGTYVHVVDLRKVTSASEPNGSLMALANLTGPPCVATQALLNGVQDLSEW